MPINVYTGLMRSGKSYEVVSQVILAAILQGRRVVTNVDGISNDLVREYVAKKNNVDIEKLGVVHHVANGDVFKPDFFPFYDDDRGEHVDTIVQPGDLVCIDEAWRFWGSDCKLHKHHKSFFLEHGHFTHPTSGVACDLVLMIQDMGTLHRFVKAVVAFSFRTHKKISLGMGNTYSITMWEGAKQVKATQTGNWVRRYQKDVFPLYNSFKGGADGKTVNVDSRQNIFTNKKLWFGVVLFFVIGYFSIKNIYTFFNPVSKDKAVATRPGAAAASGAPSGSGAAVAASRPSGMPVFSGEWRYVGELRIGADSFAVVASENGRLRFESPSVFKGRGLLAAGLVDGYVVTTFSGHLPSSSSVGSAKSGPVAAVAGVASTAGLTPSNESAPVSEPSFFGAKK